MGGVIYGLCAATAFLCACLLLQAYRRSHYKLLLWSGICFVGLTLNNLLLVVDKLLITSRDLTVWRTGAALISLSILLYGLIWDRE